MDKPEFLIVIWFGAALIFGLIGAALGGSQGTMGFFMGFLFGPIGLVIAAIVGGRKPERIPENHGRATMVQTSWQRRPPRQGNFHIQCPACGSSFEVSDALIGRTGECDACGEKFVI